MYIVHKDKGVCSVDLDAVEAFENVTAFDLGSICFVNFHTRAVDVADLISQNQRLAVFALAVDTDHSALQNFSVTYFDHVLRPALN